MKTSLLFLACSLAFCSAGQYSGYEVLETSVLTRDQAKALSQLEATFDFWRRPHVGGKAKIMATPQQKKGLERFLSKHDIDFVVSVGDVHELIQKSERPVENPIQRDSRLDSTKYYRHDEINSYIDELAATYDWAESVSIGSTFEGRDMRALELKKAGDGAPIIFIEAGIHAREWIAPAVALYTISQLVENYDRWPQYADNLNFFITPSANPDGYEYSWEEERLWRKSRSDFGNRCIGTDLNRNWEYHYGESGTSDNSCSDIYNGPEAFSDVEARNLRDYFLSMSQTPEVAICFHSAAELWLYPYGYDYNAYPDNVDEVRDLALRAVEALNAENGQNFVVINSAELYPAAGASDDWYTSQGARYAYTPELRDNGYGFLLPPELIIPSGEEIWAAWQVILDQVLANNGL